MTCELNSCKREDPAVAYAIAFDKSLKNFVDDWEHDDESRSNPKISKPQA
jgi:hypothetical protein